MMIMMYVSSLIVLVVCGLILMIVSPPSPTNVHPYLILITRVRQAGVSICLKRKNYHTPEMVNLNDGEIECTDNDWLVKEVRCSTWPVVP